MSIPLDRLYHFINNITDEICGDDTVIIRPYPHGSKKLEDLTVLVNDHIVHRMIKLHVYCHDQEPLQYNAMSHARSNMILDPFSVLRNSVTTLKTNLFPNIRWHGNINDLALLLHSEKRSSNLKQYQDNIFITVYYWSHAVIALDWFRFAQHISQRKQVQKTFLVYNRAWSGTREYRLKFAELLVRLGLQNTCCTSINPVEPEIGIHYELHQFDNPMWRPTTVLENYFPISTAQSHYSADFDIQDYEATDIEVVLETLFDDSRLHLTEKSLRPIACAQPFILAGTHGSLEYLRSYGFKNSGDIWDEQYDLVEDPEERLMRITDLMKQIANWTPQVRENKMSEALVIANYNKKHFFSDDFFNHVISELRDNVKSAFNIYTTENTCHIWLNRWKILSANKEILNFLKTTKKSLSPNDIYRQALSLDDIKYLIQIAEQQTTPSQ